MRLWLPIVIATFIATFPLVALADGATPGDDEIRLKDGGMLRGTIVSVEPGNEATIIVKGKEKTIPWSNIEKVEQGKYKVDAEEEEAPPKKVKKSKKDQEGDDEMTEPAKGAPLIHIEGTYPAIQLSKIEQVVSVYSSRGTATGIVTRSACVAPCDTVIDGRDGAQYFFSASGMVPSSPFSLTQYNGGIEARVNGGSGGLRLGAYLVSSVGLVGLIFGPIHMYLESGRSAYETDPTNPDKPYQPNYTTGGLILGAGVVAVAAGIFMVVASRTTFEIRPRDSESAGIRIENGVLRF